MGMNPHRSVAEAEGLDGPSGHQFKNSQDLRVGVAEILAFVQQVCSKNLYMTNSVNFGRRAPFVLGNYLLGKPPRSRICCAARTRVAALTTPSGACNTATRVSRACPVRSHA